MRRERRRREERRREEKEEEEGEEEERTEERGEERRGGVKRKTGGYLAVSLDAIVVVQIEVCQPSVPHLWHRREQQRGA